MGASFPGLGSWTVERARSRNNLFGPAVSEGSVTIVGGEVIMEQSGSPHDTQATERETVPAGGGLAATGRAGVPSVNPLWKCLTPGYVLS